MALKLPHIQINKTWLMLIAAIGLALLATILTTRYLKSREASIAAEVKAKAQQGGPKVTAVVPVRNLLAGTQLTESLVAARPVPADLIYPGAILASDFSKYKGKSLVHPVLKGRPLLKTDLGIALNDFAGSLVKGTRAMTVDVDELNSVAHMIQPGNLIDLLLEMRRDDGGQTVVPFMSRMKVLATGQRLTNDSDESGPGQRRFSYANLTLQVTPVQAARLTLAQDIGKLRFILRNPKDEQRSDFSVNTQNILDEIIARARHSRHRGSVSTGSVEFIIGGERGTGTNAKAVEVAAPPASPKSPLASAGKTSIAAPAETSTTKYDSNGLTPEMKSELKKLIAK